MFYPKIESLISVHNFAVCVKISKKKKRRKRQEKGYRMVIEPAIPSYPKSD
jgi:hypothetical protein